MTIKETIQNAQPFLVAMYRWLTDAGAGDVSATLKINGVDRIFTFPNAKKASTGYAQLASSYGVTTHEVSSASEIRSIISHAPIGGYVQFKATTDIVIDINTKIYCSFSLDMNRHGITFAEEKNGKPNHFIGNMYTSPIVTILNGTIYTPSVLPSNSSRYHTPIVGWISRLRVVLASMDIVLNKGSLINAHSAGSIDVKVKSCTVSKGADYATSSSIVYGSNGTYLLDIASLTYNDSLVKDDCFLGTYI